MLLRVALMALLPIVPFVVLYVALDPYRVLRHHVNYYTDRVSFNSNLLTLHTFEDLYPSQRYNSFIVGSSLAINLPAKEWEHHLQPDARPFHFNAGNLNLHNTRMFLEYLDRHADTISNVLIPLTPHVLRLQYSPNNLATMIPPEIDRSGIGGLLRFHYRYFRRVTDYGFYASYLPWILRGETVNFPGCPVFYEEEYEWDRVLNEEYQPISDSIIAVNPAEYYFRHKVYTPAPSDSYTEASRLIDDALEADLRAIAEICRRRGADLTVIATPTLKLEIFDPEDEKRLRDIFGESYVNLQREFRQEVADSTNWYDNTHYRPVMGKRFIDRAYEIRRKR